MVAPGSFLTRFSCLPEAALRSPQPGSSDNNDLLAADTDTADIDYGILRVELTAGHVCMAC